MLPIIHLKGTPHEQGLTHGKLARDAIRQNLEIYFERFQSEGKLSLSEVQSRAEKYWAAIQRQNNNYAQSLMGVAEGSGFDLLKLVALNVRYEIMYHQFMANSFADGCSVIAIAPSRSANGHLLMGENWDWIPNVKGLVLYIEEGTNKILCFTEAGIVGGKLGLNNYGLGLGINGLNTTIDDWARLRTPFHVRCYEILRARSLQEAEVIITGQERSCSANYLIAQVEDQIKNIETAPESVLTLKNQNGMVAHTNHFVEPGDLHIEEPPNDNRPYSCQRLDRVYALLQKKHKVSLDDIRDVLSDHQGHPYAICRHIDEALSPAEHYQTVIAVLMDLHERTLWISDGPPCESPFQKFSI